jgi:Glycosyl transferase family 2.
VEPLVSIVIPTLNSAKTVRKTLESIKLLNYSNV